MAAHEKTEPVYMIGVVANLTTMHAQTIRLYERLGSGGGRRAGC